MVMLIEALYRQSLIAQRNSLQYSLLRNWSAQRAMLNGFCNPYFAGSLELQGIADSTQLMAVNGELNALNNINYLA